MPATTMIFILQEQKEGLSARYTLIHFDTLCTAVSPGQLRKMMRVIEVVCAAFGLTVSEAKTEIMCLRTKGMPESTTTFSIEAAGQVCSQTNEFIYPEGASTAMPTYPSRSIGAYATVTNGAASGSTPSNCTADRVLLSSSKPRCSEPRYSRQCCTARVPLRHAAPSPPQLLDSLHRYTKEQSHRPLDFLSRHAYQDGK